MKGKAKLTITEAALEVLKSAEGTMSIQEVYEGIVDRSLYAFHAQNPLDVVRVELRKHSIGIDFPTASKKKYFVYDETNGRFRALHKSSERTSSANKDKTYLTQVRNLYDSYLKDFKTNILVQLKRMNAYDFEEFCMQLLKVYGFINVAVTQKSRDGGID